MRHGIDVNQKEFVLTVIAPCLYWLLAGAMFRYEVHPITNVLVTRERSASQHAMLYEQCADEHGVGY